MFPIIDQNRHENQTVHVHMHQVCSCMYPFYTTFRPPLLTPFHLQPLPRPYNMHHYQFTQFNMSPLNVPLMQNGAVPISQTNLNTPNHQSFDFGPPPRDRRSFEGSDNQNIPNPGDEIKENDTGRVEEFFLGDIVQPQHEYESQNGLFTSETFTKFLEQGCVIAEKIAIRNQHRPCFKNIQNLCNRTRSEILKPSNTVSNIHSQGIPWATKDFIYAYVRLINCWHMLKGYLETKDGTLGNIDRELTSDFKNCYLLWEKNTKVLAGHMIRIFTNLDNNVSNPNLVQINKLKEKNHREKVAEAPVITQINQNPPINSIVNQSISDSIQKPTPIEQKQSKRNSISDLIENILLSESTISPQDEDSDNESRVYMKPGSYNVPKKGKKDGNGNNDSSNSSPSIEFFETAQNVSAHYKKIAKRKDGKSSNISNDKMWQDAQSAVPYLMDKINHPKDLNKDVHVKKTETGGGDIEEDALKYFVDLNTLEHHSDIQEWLDNSNFHDHREDILEDAPAPPPNVKQVTVLQRAVKGFYKAPLTKTYRKLEREDEKGEFSRAPGYKKNNTLNWEIGRSGGGINDDVIIVLEEIIKILDKEGLPKWIGFAPGKDSFDHPMSLISIRKKLNSKKYNSVCEFVRDVKNLLSSAEVYYEAHPEVLRQLGYFRERFDALINKEFSVFEGSLDNKPDGV